MLRSSRREMRVCEIDYVGAMSPGICSGGLLQRQVGIHAEGAARGDDHVAFDGTRGSHAIEIIESNKCSYL